MFHNWNRRTNKNLTSKILLMDEPFAALDITIKKSLYKELFDFIKKLERLYYLLLII